MARSKAEVRQFLESLIGRTCVDQSDHGLNGQCVCLIKNLMDFLGVANPYAGRGNAKDAGTNYIAADIGEAGRGWLTICVNPNMGGGYGHIWVDLKDEANYESNGDIPLVVTKNTRPFNQATQLINFDKWIGETIVDKIPDQDNYYGRYNREMSLKRGRDISGKGFSRAEFRKSIVGLTNLRASEVISDDKEANEAHSWMRTGYLAIKDKWQQQIYDLQAVRTKLTQERNAARDEAAKLKTQVQGQTTEIADLKAKLALQTDDTKNLNALGQSLQWAVKRLGLK